MHSYTEKSIHYQWLNQPEQLRTWLEPINNHDVIAIDTEFTRQRTFYAQLSLLQLAHDNRFALVDPLAFDIGQSLVSTLGQRPITSILHSAGEDIEILSRYLPHGPQQLFDTQVAAAFCGYGASVSYQSLVETFSGKHLGKSETRSNWNQRPLSHAQIHYALLDVTYLADIHTHLYNQLEQKGLLNYFHQDMHALKQRVHIDTIPQQPQLKVSAASNCDISQQALLRRILIWREEQARHLDKPRKWLFDDHQALAMVSTPHTNELSQNLTRSCLGKAHTALLKQQLDTPVSDQDIAQTLPMIAHHQLASKQDLQKAGKVIEHKARELGIPASLLCSRKHLKTLLARHSWPQALNGWRQKILTPGLNPWIGQNNLG